MLQMNAADLERVRDECLGLVRQRAWIAAVVAVVPVPGLDVAADARLLARLLPEITERFGLSPAKIRQMPTAQREQAARQMRSRQRGFAGQVASPLLLRQRLGAQLGRLLATQVAKFIPLTGSAVAGWLGYEVVAQVARRYVDDCHEVASTLWREQGHPPLPAGNPG